MQLELNFKSKTFDGVTQIEIYEVIPDNENEFRQAVLKRAEVGGFALKPDEIECTELVVCRIPDSGCIDAGGLYLDINKNKDMMPIRLTKENGSSYVDTETLKTILLEWLESEESLQSLFKNIADF